MASAQNAAGTGVPSVGNMRLGGLADDAPLSGRRRLEIGDDERRGHPGPRARVVAAGRLGPMSRPLSLTSNDWVLLTPTSIEQPLPVFRRVWRPDSPASDLG
ncbi:MAG: hypothetical protein ACRDQB_04590 [Thermocrispum sp.]